MTPTIRFITLNPGHFHAALVQKEMYEQVAPQVNVYAPLGPDLIAHLARIAGFNTRATDPTKWELEVHACEDYLARVAKEKPGNVVVLAGRNAGKIDAILAALDAGLNVLADKPWILVPADLPKIQQALDLAETRGLVAYDIMTERYEVTSQLQRAFVQDEATFGTIVPGSPDEPGVFMESVHFLKKFVAGVPLRRPAWFFDVHQQGEALSDVGTHLVDLAMWILYPEQPISAQDDVSILSAKRWPTVLKKTDFQQITGEVDYPHDLYSALEGDDLHYYCNTLVQYALRGIHVKLNVLWDFEAAPGAGDTHLAVFRGTRSRVEVRQGREEKYQPELYIIPNRTMEYALVRRAIELKLRSLQVDFPGVGVTDLGTHFRVAIPREFRVGHEAHFAQVTKQFLRYLQKQDAMPAWEKPNMMAKYTVTTRGVEASRAT
ncbi:MAG: oxidoreductase [Planctomycetes bacterium]|jgi:predicted dehydrogenase|nr:oxidoreductase [Planctomycetota bacterium]